MGKVDTKLTGEEERNRRRILEQHEGQMKEDRRKQREIAACSALLMLSDPDYIATGVSSLSSEDEVEEPKWRKRVKISAETAVNPELAAALDRTNVSSRKAAFILHEAAKAYMDKIWLLCPCLWVAYMCTGVVHILVMKRLHMQEQHLLVVDLW